MIPVELVDIIVGHLHNDLPTLKMCALVSPTWLISSRYHLFERLSVALHPHGEQEELNLVAQCFETGIGQVSRPFVRSLRVCASPGASYGGSPMHEPCLDLHVLGQLINMLENLRSLMLLDVAWPGLSPDASPPLTSCSVTSLVVRRTHSDITSNPGQFKHIRDGLDILHLLPSLKELYTLGSPWDATMLNSESLPHGSRKKIPFPASLKLESLDLRAEGNVIIFIQYSRRRLDFSSLTKLSIWWFDADDLPSIGKLIAASTNLRHVDLMLCNPMFFDHGECRLSVSSPQLITLWSQMT